MATRQGAVTSLRSGLLGDAPGRAGRRSCHRARGTRTPGRCAPGAAPLGQRLRNRRETPRAPWGARPNARSRGRMAGDRRCSRGVRPSAGAGRSVDAGAGKRRARRGSADVPAPDPRGAQAPAARGAEAGQAAGLVPPPRDGSISRDAPAPGVNRPAPKPHTPRRASSPKPRLRSQRPHPHRHAPPSAFSPSIFSPHPSHFFLGIAPSHHTHLHLLVRTTFLRHEKPGSRRYVSGTKVNSGKIGRGQFGSLGRFGFARIQ